MSFGETGGMGGAGWESDDVTSVSYKFIVLKLVSISSSLSPDKDEELEELDRVGDEEVDPSGDFTLVSLKG